MLSQSASVMSVKALQSVMAEVMMAAVERTADPPASRKDDN
jgi:hypothetical protein